MNVPILVILESPKLAHSFMKPSDTSISAVFANVNNLRLEVDGDVISSVVAWRPDRYEEVYVNVVITVKHESCVPW